MKEVWKDVVGYEGLYQVSSFGQVKMLGREKRLWHGGKTYISPKLLNQNIICGYKKVKLRDSDGNAKMVSVHRLVAKAFIENPNNFPQVNHKDEDKTNNFVFVNKDGTVDYEKSNLEWCTAKYNTNYGTGIKRCSEAKFKRIAQISLDGNIIKEWNSMKEIVKTLGFSYSRLSQACNGITKTSNGYIWKFI
jgi:hypothetical protein